MMLKNKATRLLSAILIAMVISCSLFISGIAATDNDAETSAPEVTESVADASDETTASAETTTSDDDASDEDKGLSLSFWISMGVLTVLVALAVVFGVKNKEKLGKWFRSIKSELKKIVWMPWSDVKKNTMVVIVVVVALGLTIALLDFAFSKGIFALGQII